MKCLILGATGRLGQMLQWGWADRSDLSVVWQTRTHPVGPAARAGQWIVGNPLLPDGNLKMACQNADCVINLLGVTPSTDADLDLNTALALAPFAMGCAAPVIVSSSAAVYGSAQTVCVETGPVSPLHAYGHAKLAMEQAVRSAPGTALILRIGNIAGADQLLGGLKPDQDPVLHCFEDGATPMRSYISPRGMADGLVGLAQTYRSWPDIVNMSAPRPVTMGGLLAQAGRNWTPAPAPQGLPRTVVFDTTRLAQLIDTGRLATTPKDIVADWQDWRTATGGFQ